MNIVVRNIVAVIVGIFVGMAVNMSLIMISGSVIPAPNGSDISTEGLKASIHLWEPKHFIFPFLAHALGTFAGALITALIAANNKMKLALLIALIFLIGGISAVIMLPSPLWFDALDLLGAYIPFGYLAAKIVLSRSKIDGPQPV